MEKSDIRYKTYVDILKRELLPAMGCTEPIAIAYCAARARALLGCIPDSVLIEASGNIIKNVKSVIVPNTNGAKGIEAAAAAGIIAGKEELKLEVLSQVTDEEKEKLLDHMLLNQLLDSLTDTERELIEMRYFQDKTQTEVAGVMGISQVQVSRLEKKILLRMREQLVC